MPRHGRAALSRADRADAAGRTFGRLLGKEAPKNTSNTPTNETPTPAPRRQWPGVLWAYPEGWSKTYHAVGEERRGGGGGERKIV